MAAQGRALVGIDVENIDAHQLRPHPLPYLLIQQPAIGGGEFLESWEVNGVRGEGLVYPALLLPLPVQVCSAVAHYEQASPLAPLPHLS